MTDPFGGVPGRVAPGGLFPQGRKQIGSDRGGGWFRAPPPVDSGRAESPTTEPASRCHALGWLRRVMAASRGRADQLWGQATKRLADFPSRIPRSGRRSR